ncbi:MAG TPA: LysR substrate-binding domain-containing protein [Burkholderiales bacterium]|nr:LysR substrate-binding domain-containing protein [Burkholderiales bacterium]
MSERLPSLDLLKGFEAVARHLSFTKAAAELFVTQSAVSRQIRQLEEHLGVRLFERRTRAVVLTEAGYVYYSELAPLLERIDALTHKVAAARGVRRVRVTTTLTFSSLWLVPRLAAFQEKHPDVHVHVVADNVMRDLARDDFDVAVRYCAQSDAGASALRLFEETVTPVLSPKLLGRRRLKRLENLNEYVLLHFHDLEGRAPWLSWDQFFAEAKAPEVRGKGAAYFSHYDQAIRAARSAQGVALGRFPVIDMLVQEGELVAPFPASSAIALPDRAYWLIVPPARAQKTEVELFVTWLGEQAARSAQTVSSPSTGAG